MTYADEEHAELDPRAVSLEEWLRLHPWSRTGTFTFNGVTYTDMNEVEWRRANNDWLLPE